MNWSDAAENAKASEAIAWRKLSKLEAALQRAKEEAGRAPRRIISPAIATCYYQDATCISDAAGSLLGRSIKSIVSAADIAALYR